MRVTCKLCQFESSGNCTKKKQSGKPKKIKLTKRRTCKIYEEDTMKVFAQYRKNESHRASVRQKELKSAQMSAIMRKLQAEKTARGIDGQK